MGIEDSYRNGLQEGKQKGMEHGKALTPRKRLAWIALAVIVAFALGYGYAYAIYGDTYPGKVKPAAAQGFEEPPKANNPLPLNDSDNPFVAKMCWRLPACPLTILFGAPLVMVAAVWSAGGRHPALLIMSGAATFFGFMVLLQPNPFTVIAMGLVSIGGFLAWRTVRT